MIVRTEPSTGTKTVIKKLKEENIGTFLVLRIRISLKMYYILENNVKQIHIKPSTVLLSLIIQRYLK